MKSKKLLSSLMALSIIATSSLVLGINVQAKSVENTPKTDVTQRSIIAPNQKYTYCGKMNHKAIQDLWKYFKNNSNNYSVMDIRNILIQNGMDRSLANNVSYSIYDLQMETKNFTLGISRVEYGVGILQAENGTYTLIQIDSESEPAQSYSFYGLLDPSDTALIRDHLKSPNYNGVKSTTQYLIDKNIVSDPVVAEKLAWGVYSLGNEIDGLVALNQNLLVLKSDDGKYYRIAHKSK